jgi:hypothetical protein
MAQEKQKDKKAIKVKFNRRIDCLTVTQDNKWGEIELVIDMEDGDGITDMQFSSCHDHPFDHIDSSFLEVLGHLDDDQFSDLLLYLKTIRVAINKAKEEPTETEYNMTQNPSIFVKEDEEFL